jgi:hypothetical protein
MTLQAAVAGVVRTRRVNSAIVEAVESDERLSPRVALLGILGLSTGLWAMLAYLIG